MDLQVIFARNAAEAGLLERFGKSMGTARTHDKNLSVWPKLFFLSTLRLSRLDR